MTLRWTTARSTTRSTGAFGWPRWPISPARNAPISGSCAPDGNLSVHLRKLEDAGYVSIEKRFEGKKPVTTACMTDVGREAWIAYLDRMKAMLFGEDGE